MNAIAPLLAVLVVVWGSELSFDKDCYVPGNEARLTSTYNGSESVEFISWYYEKQIGDDYLIRASDCTILTDSNGLPDGISFECEIDQSFKLILASVTDEELGKTWGSKFLLLDAGTAQRKTTVLMKCNCSALMPPSNGQVMNRGDTANYRCSKGYTLSGTTMRTCKADDTWSDSAPTCIRVTTEVPSFQTGNAPFVNQFDMGIGLSGMCESGMASHRMPTS